MPRQTRDWTCSACSLAWLNRAMGIDRATDEMAAAVLIGMPHNINQQFGLMDGSGSRLAQLLKEDRGMAWTANVEWDEARALSIDHALLLGGRRWYHWVGCRGIDGDLLWIANSAPGWKGVQDRLDHGTFNELGPWAAVVVPIYWEFPEIE